MEISTIQNEIVSWTIYIFRLSSSQKNSIGSKAAPSASPVEGVQKANIIRLPTIQSEKLNNEKIQKKF